LSKEKHIDYRSQIDDFRFIEVARAAQALAPRVAGILAGFWGQ